MENIKPRKAKSTIETAALNLRALVQSVEPGSLLGSEENLIGQLGVSRTTLRQVARLLEREGWLNVKRGINGGYFSARPGLKALENSINAYLEMNDADVKDTAVVGTMLWMEILRRAATSDPERAKAVVQNMREKVLALRPQAGLDEVMRVDFESRTAFIKLVDSRYLEFLFQINMIYASRKFFARSPDDFEASPPHFEFVQAWRQGKLMELAAVECGDKDLAVLAARHSRHLWYRYWRSVDGVEEIIN